jgi:hypothetical protein
MIKVNKYLTIAQDTNKYLSFPDIIKSPFTDNRLFLVYREGESHHPTWSKLVLLSSDDNGENWEKIKEFPLNISKNGYVWNCPRLSYINNDLGIICDQKNSTIERTSTFKTSIIYTNDIAKYFGYSNTLIPGMVPDKVISFKDYLFCANHRIKSIKNDIVQLISWSRDKGMTWFDTNLMAHSSSHQFCEASVVNMGDYMVSYLRDNSGHKKPSFITQSKDGIKWSEPSLIPIFGQRITAIKDVEDEDSTIGSYRNTNYMNDPFLRVSVNMFEHNIKTNDMVISEIDWEYPENQYHFGYTGLAQISKDNYIIAYYIKQREKNPYIKLAFVSKIKE